MKKLKTTINYRVTNWCYCNLEHGGAPLEEKCRFCTVVKRGKQQVHVCTLHNEPLTVSEGFVIYKCPDCLKQVGEVEDDYIKPSDPAPVVPPKDLIKWAIDKYQKCLNSMIREGYPVEIAQKYARQQVLSPGEPTIIK